VRHPVLAGEPLVAARLAPDGLTGAAALVPPGWRAVAVPLGPAGAPPLAVGDLVDVLAVMPTAGLPGLGSDGAGAGPDGTGPDGAAQEPAFVLVERAAVVDVTDDAVTVAVPEGDAPRVAWALSNGAVVLALGGG
jgi:Flp pilus assembly protein CpaB